MHDDFHQRLKELYRMLFELSTGNLIYRIESQNQDDITKLAESLNTFAAQMQLIVRKSGYVVPYYSYQNLAHSALILDPDLIVIGFTKDAPAHFGYESERLLGIPCDNLIHIDSKGYWNQIVSDMRQQSDFYAHLQLQFLTASGQIQPSFCSVYRLLGTDNYLISCVTTTIEEIAELNRNVTAENSEAQMIQNLYQYIMENLEKPLPTIRELAVLFKTNDFKLKQGFRHFFKSGIHAFYNSERLKRAQLLIQQTDLPLKTVALMSGFQDYGTFSKAFKKKFGYGPGALSRNP